ncbi:MAG: hypothetical protein Q4G58_14570 [bacterium]|nr:hypothetical protein [bacterium]
MMTAIIYTTNTGNTAGYAKLLSEETGLPYYSLEEAKKRLPAQTEVIYLGWIMASEIKGYKAANSRYIIRAACAVGMGETGAQVDEVRKRNKISEATPLFTLRGGFDVKKLHGIYKVMMQVMVKTAGKALEAKKDRTEEEDIMLEMMQHGGNYVCYKNLNDVIEWYRKTRILSVV